MRIRATTSGCRLPLLSAVPPRAYPQVDEFFELKGKYDPDELFQNEFYLKYGTKCEYSDPIRM